MLSSKHKFEHLIASASVRESSITGAVLLSLFTVPAILRVSHLWHERRCRPPQMRMRAKPAPLYIFSADRLCEGKAAEKENSPGTLISRLFLSADSRTPTCMRELSHGPDGSVTLVKKVCQRISSLRITH